VREVSLRGGLIPISRRTLADGHLRLIQSYSELFRPKSLFPISPRNAGLQTGNSRNIPVSLRNLNGRARGPAPLVPGEPNLNGAPPMVTYGHLRTVILTKCRRFSALPLDVRCWMLGVRCSDSPVSPLRDPLLPHVHGRLALTPRNQPNVAPPCRKTPNSGHSSSPPASSRKRVPDQNSALIWVRPPLACLHVAIE
jgi:hypothetical protein